MLLEYKYEVNEQKIEIYDNARTFIESLKRYKCYDELSIELYEKECKKR